MFQRHGHFGRERRAVGLSTLATIAVTRLAHMIVGQINLKGYHAA